MRRYLLLIFTVAMIVWFFVPVPVMAQTLPVIVHQCDAALTGNQSSITCSFGASVTAGNRMIIGCGATPSSTTGFTFTFSNSAGDSFPGTPDSGSAITLDGAGSAVQTSSVVIGATGTSTPKCTFSSSTHGSCTNCWGIQAYEVSGLGAVDVNANGASLTPAASAFYATLSSPLVTTMANDFVFTFCDNTTFIDQGGTGQVLLQLDNNFGMLGEYQFLFHAGAVLPFMVNGNTSANGACNVVAYKFTDQTPVNTVTINNSSPTLVITAATTWTWTCVVDGGGSNHLLTAYIDYTSGADSATAMQLDGSSTGWIRKIQLSDSGNLMTGEIWYLKAPSAGSHTCKATFNTARSGWGIAQDFTNVNQTTPLANEQSSASGTNTTTQTVTSATGDLVVVNVLADAEPLCYNGTIDWTNDQSTFDLPSFMMGHWAGAPSITSTSTEVTLGFPGGAGGGSPIVCPGTVLSSTSFKQIQIAEDVQAAIVATGALQFGATKTFGGTVVW